MEEKWDLIVIGGGITGAGIFRIAVGMGLRTLLLEQNDFAWGTSGRSSKMVHGGLRYLKQGKIFLTRESVNEREYLLKAAPGLVEPLEFLMPLYRRSRPGRLTMGAGLSIYSALAGSLQFRYYGSSEFMERVPSIRGEELAGGYGFFDAGVDDARLVLRLILEGERLGGTALNYTKVEKIVRGEGSTLSPQATLSRFSSQEPLSSQHESSGNVLSEPGSPDGQVNVDGAVRGVIACDRVNGKMVHAAAPLVINATGAWATSIHAKLPSNLHMRPLRGSHLIFPFSCIPVGQVVSFFHPEDGRPVFLFPWEGATFLGTTDVDHSSGIDVEPSISAVEAQYLMSALKWAFPEVNVGIWDAISSIAGIRPVLSSGKRAPSDESREHFVWKDGSGLVSVTGGKLTTFRKLAADALEAAAPFLPEGSLERHSPDSVPLFERVKSVAVPHPGLSADRWRRLCGRYGRAAYTIVEKAAAGDFDPVQGTAYLWAELKYAAGHERVRTLSDLLMRRVRIGLILPHGAKEHFSRIKSICLEPLGWDERRFEREASDYMELWNHAHRIP